MSDFPKKITDEYNGQQYDAPFSMNAQQQEVYNKYMFAKEQYLALVHFLNTPSDATDEETGEPLGYGKNEYGFQKNMNEKTLAFLSKKCHALNSLGQTLISKIKPEKISAEKDLLLFDINYNTKLARQDSDAIEAIDPEHIPSYTAMRRNANYTVIDTGEEQLDKVGGQMSSRIMLRYIDGNGNIQKGFFTKDCPIASDDEDIKAVYTQMKLQPGGNANSRNSSMSDMAALLNMGHLIAHSTEMTIIENGIEFHGTFMSNAKGVDINDVNKTEFVIEGRNMVCDYNTATRSASDLMALDYICLNVDRHQNNCFYDIQKNKKGELVIKGFQGIDNDMSFGELVPDTDETVSNLPPITILKCLHEDTANRILSLTRESITSTLISTGRTEAEINACWERTKQLQYRIKNKNIEVKKTFTEQDFKALVPGERKGANAAYNALLVMQRYNKKKDQVIDDLKPERQAYIDAEMKRLAKKAPEPFENRSFKNQLTEKLNSIFLHKKKQELADEEFAKKINKDVEGLHHKVRLDSKLTIKRQAKDFDKLYNRLWSPKENDIDEYKKMYNSMKALHTLLQDFSDKDLAFLSDMDRNRLAAHFSTVEDKIKKYIPAISSTPSRNDLKRIGISQGILDVCVRARDQREQAVNELNETMAGAHRAIGDAHKLLDKAAKAGKDAIEYIMAKTELEAKSTLGGFLGALTVPAKEDKEKIHDALAKLTVIEKLKRMETEDPDRYKTQMAFLKENPAAFKKMTSDLLGKNGFKKLANSIDYRFALADHAEKGLAIQCDKARLFKDLIVERKTAQQRADILFEKMTKQYKKAMAPKI